MDKKASKIVNECVKLWKETEAKTYDELGYFHPLMHLPKKCFELKKEFETLTGKDWNTSYEEYVT